MNPQRLLLTTAGGLLLVATARADDPLPVEARERNWTIVDMKKDWKRVYP